MVVRYYLVGIMLLTFVTFGVDKVKAICGAWRIPEAASDSFVDRRRWRCFACNARVPAQNSEGRVQGKRHRFRLRVELRSVALPRRDFLTAAAALYGAAAFLLSFQTDIFGLQHENHEQRKRRKKKCMDW